MRISVEFQEEVSEPNVRFMLRNRLGEDVSGTNVGQLINFMAFVSAFLHGKDRGMENHDTFLQERIME